MGNHVKLISISICRVSRRDSMKWFRNMCCQRIHPSNQAKRSRRVVLKNSIAKVHLILLKQREFFSILFCFIWDIFVFISHADDSFSSTNSSRSTVARTTTLNGHQSADDEPPLMRPVRTGRAKPTCYVSISIWNKKIHFDFIIISFRLHDNCISIAYSTISFNWC